MRKLFVLIMTSVLATGAVANADQMTVEKNPENYINFLGIKKQGEEGYLGDGDVIKPHRQTEFPAEVEAGYAYNLDVEITDDDNDAPLNQVAICLYDADQLQSDPDDVLDECGTGYDLDTSDNTLLNKTGTSTSRKRVDRTLLIHYDPNGSTGEKIEAFRGTHAASVDDAGNTSVDNDTNADIHDLSIEFTISDAADHSDDWKVRIFAQYQNTANPDVLEEIELTSENSYEVKYYSEMITDSAKIASGDTLVERGDVNLGTLVQSGSVEKREINTGLYRANGTSDIEFKATAFQKTGDTALAFSTNTGSLSDNEFSLSCGPDEDPDTNQVLLEAADSAKNLLTELSEFGGYIDHEAYHTAPQHKCILNVGDVPTGTYDNVVTLSIGETPEAE